MRYRVLGPVEARAAGIPVRLGGPKQRLVLAMLLVEADRPVSDDRLVDGVWGREPPARSRHILQTYVSELRRLLDDEIRRQGSGYRLIVDRDAVDAHRFEVLVDSARERLPGAPAGAAATLREALALWHGPPYADLAHVPALQPEVNRLEQLRLAAVEDRIRADLECGRHAAVVTELEALTREHPYREGFRAAHMVGLYRCGRQADALLVYERTRELLADELGIDPAPELQALQRQILEQDPELEALHGGGGSPAARPGAAELVADDGVSVVRGFELRDRLGRGDLGTTYRAYQASIGREVAVKVIEQQGAQTAAFVRSFESRTAAITRLNHPHLVPLLDSWRDSRAVYVVTPWFPAGDARRTLHAGAWSLPATLRLLEQVGGALASAHQHGVVHGHVKATNVLIDADGNAYLTDFPLVSRTADAVGAPQSTTPSLVPPEEHLGRPLSPRSDVHGLALLAVELLQGSIPDAEETISALARARQDLPPAMLDILRRGTHADGDVRHDRVEDLLRDLRRVAGVDVVGVPTTTAPSRFPRNPYKGLQSFREADAADFFGRESLTQRLVEAVGAQRLVAVVGPSGSGKSSLVRAGLIPALRAGGLPGSREWLVTELYPGSHPFEELEAALRRVAVETPDGMLAELLSDDRGLLRVVKQILPRDDSELVLVIDQFEELFVLTSDPGTRRLFLDSLVALAADGRGRVRTVLTLRADFFDRPLEHHAFGELVEAGLVPVTMPAPDELMRAVTQPARQVGAEFEDGLAPSIVRDVADQPGGLPLLQHALTELFAGNEGPVLRAAAYRAAGGVMGSLGRRADELFRSLSPAGKDAAQQILLRLVTVDEHNEDARRRVRRSELTGLTADPDTIDEVIRLFGAHRLLTFDRDPVTRTPTIEVAHEALFREWERLRGWIDARRTDLLLHRRLAVAVAEWIHSGRHADYLLAGGRLEQFTTWSEETSLALTGDERNFLDASRSRQAALLVSRRRRRTMVLAAAIGVAILALGLAAFAVRNQQRAIRGERVAVARALAADSRAQLATDHDRAVLLALEAVEATRAAGAEPLPEAVQALHDAVRLHRLVQSADHDGFIVRFLGGRRMLSAGPPGFQPVVWNLESGERLRALLQHSGREPTGVAVSADGRWLAETYIGEPVRIWDLESGRMTGRIQPPGDGQWRPVFSPGGSTLAVLDDRRGQWWLSIWDVQAEVELASVPAPADPTTTAFSPTGDVVAVAGRASARVWLYDATTGQQIATVGRDDRDRGVSSIAFHPDGRLATYLSRPSEIRIMEVGAEEPEITLPVGADPNTLCVTGDGSAIAATAADEIVRVWDAQTGDLALQLPGTSLGGVIDCGPTGAMIATASGDGTARIWDITPEGEGDVLTIATPPPWTARWTRDGEAILSTHADGTLRRHDASTGRMTGRIAGLAPDPSSRVVVSPDGRVVATVGHPSSDTTPGALPSVVLRDGLTLESIRDVGMAGWPLAFGPDAAWLLIGSPDGMARYDVEKGAIDWQLDAPAIDAAVDADGRYAAVAAPGAADVRVIDLATGHATASFCAAGPTRRVAVSPDGRLLAVATPEAVEVFDFDDIRDRRGSADCGPDGSSSGDPARLTDFRANAWLGLDFSPDSQQLATAGFDGLVGIWDSIDGTRRLGIAHEARVGGAVFSPNGSRLAVTVNATRGRHHTVRVYTLDIDELIAIARATVTDGASLSNS